MEASGRSHMSAVGSALPRWSGTSVPVPRNQEQIVVVPRVVPQERDSERVVEQFGRPTPFIRGRWSKQRIHNS